MFSLGVLFLENIGCGDYWSRGFGRFIEGVDWGTISFREEILVRE